MTAVLAVHDLHVAIGHRGSATNVLRGASLEVEAGEVRGLVGESGAGKSMLGRAVLGLLPANAVITGGTILFEGRDLVAMAEPERRSLLGRRIALIPQDPMTSLNPVKRVGAQIAALLRHHLALSKRDALSRAVELLAEVAIREPPRVLELYPHEISGGMRQRVLIAMAFACDPSLVIADEPTTALDVTVQRQVLQLVERLRQRHGAAILFVTHDLGVVAKICRTMTVLHAGRVLEEGETADVLAKPRHPYTRALLAATPRADRPAEALRPVPPALIENLWAEAHRLDRQSAAASHDRHPAPNRQFELRLSGARRVVPAGGVARGGETGRPRGAARLRARSGRRVRFRQDHARPAPGAAIETRLPAASSSTASKSAASARPRCGRCARGSR